MPEPTQATETSENVFDAMEGKEVGGLTDADFLTEEEQAEAAQKKKDTESAEDKENTEDTEGKDKEGENKEEQTEPHEWEEQYGEDSTVAAGEMFKRNAELEAELNRMTGERQAEDLSNEATTPQISKEDIAKNMSEFDEKFAEKPAEAALEMIDMMVNHTLAEKMGETVQKALAPVFDHMAKQNAAGLKNTADGLVGKKFGSELMRDAQAYLKARPGMRQFTDHQEMAMNLVLSTDKWRTKAKENAFDTARAAKGKERKASGPAGRTPEPGKAKSALEKVQDEVMNAKTGKSFEWEK